MPDVVDKEAEKIWADLDAKDAAKAAGEADPPSIEGADATTGDGDATEVKTTEASAAEAIADKTDDKTASGEPRADEPDIWADAKPEQRSAHEAMRNKFDEREEAWKRMAGSVTSYQRTIKSLKDQLEATTKGASSGDDKTTGKTSAGIFDDPELKKFSEEYPEVAGPMRKVISSLEQRAERAERQLGTISEERRDANLETQAEIVYEAHSDYDKIAKSPEFTTWYEQAPFHVQEGVRRNAAAVVDGREVADIVTRYKLESGIATTTPAKSDPAPGSQKPSQTQRRAHQLQSASTPAPRGQAKVHDSGPPDDAEEAWKYWDRKDAERAAQTR